MEYDESLRGWHCWAYPGKDDDIEGWMRDTMQGDYDCDHRFNSGDPMYTIMIKNDEDATIFKLKWM